MTINNFDTSLELWTTEQTSEFLKIPISTIYAYTCDSGKNGGAKRKRFPKEIYVKLGRKILFVKHLLFNWIQNGADLHKGP